MTPAPAHMTPALCTLECPPCPTGPANSSSTPVPPLVTNSPSSLSHTCLGPSHPLCPCMPCTHAPPALSMAAPPIMAPCHRGLEGSQGASRWHGVAWGKPQEVVCVWECRDARGCRKMCRACRGGLCGAGRIRATQVAGGRPSKCGVHMEGAIFHKTCRGGHEAGLLRGAGHPGGWEARVGGAAHQHARVGRCAQWACGHMAQVHTSSMGLWLEAMGSRGVHVVWGIEQNRWEGKWANGQMGGWVNG